MATTLPKRAVRCSVHGLHYDPKLTGGCIRCRREGLVPRSRPRFVPLLLSLLVFTLIAARLLTGILEDRPSGTGIDSAEPITFAEADSRLDPGRYRDPIQRLERALFPTTAADLQSLGGLAGQAGHALATRVREDGATVEAARIASFASDLARADLDTFGLQTARDRWFMLRSTHFLDAPWLARGITPGTTDPVLVGAYLDLAGEIDRILVAAEQGGTSEAWSERLSALEARVPTAPSFGADSNLVLGFGELTAALASVRRAASHPDGLETWLQEARDHLAAGRGRLSDLG